MKKRTSDIRYIVYFILGILLLGLGAMEIVDEFWSGMGAPLVLISVLRMIRSFRLFKDENYREMVEIETMDERNRFLRSKAWAWAGYLFIVISAFAVIILKLMERDLQSRMASYGICLMMLLYWGAYMVLRKKY